MMPCVARLFFSVVVLLICGAVAPGKASAQTLGTSTITVGNAATTSSVVLSAPGAWTASSNSSFLHVSSGSTSDTGGALVLFTVDALTSTGSRTGTLTIAGLTLTVVQGGTNYAAQTGAFKLALAGDANVPAGIAVTAAGTLYTSTYSSSSDSNVQKITYPGAQSTSFGANMYGPLAVSPAGDLYIADAVSQSIKKRSAVTTLWTTLVPSITANGLALDASGNLYIANTAANAIQVMNATTFQVSNLVSGLKYIYGVAVDNAGNVYYTEADQAGVNTFTFYDGAYIEAPAGTDHGAVREWNATTRQVTTVVSANHPYDVAVDGSGNLYYLDPDYTNYNPANGNPYYNVIRKWNAATGQVSNLAEYLKVGSAGWDLDFNLGRHLAVSATGNIYFSPSTLPSGAQYVYELSSTLIPTFALAVPYGSGTGSLPSLLPGNSPDIPGIVGTPTSDQPWLTFGTVSNGVVPFSYSALGSSPASAHVNLVGVASTVAQVIAVPNVSGQTPGNATNTITSNHLLVHEVSQGVSTLPAGTVFGTSPAAGTLLPVGSAVTVLVSTGPSSLGASALSVDHTGGSYSVLLNAAVSWTAVSNSSFLHTTSSGTGNGLVLFTVDAFAGTGIRTGTLSVAGLTFTVTQYGTNYYRSQQAAEYPDYSGVYFPTGVVIDSSANWIFTDSYRAQDPNTGDLADHVQKYNPGTDHLTTLESGNFDAPGGLSMDSAGNLYIANPGDIGIQGAVSTIKLYTAATQATTTLVASGLHRATGTAVDRNGDVYIADSGSGSILKYTYATGAVTTLISGLSEPQGVALDGALNLYITDGVNNAVYKWTAATAQLSTLVTGLNSPYGVAVDGYGNLFIADTKNEAIKKWSVATGQTTTLDSTYIPQYYEDRYPYGITVDASGNILYTLTETLYLEPYGHLRQIVYGWVQTVVVPDVTGQPQATASSNLTSASLTVGAVTYALSSTVPVGNVISTSPAPGTVVTINSAVNLVVASAPINVPNVVGMTQSAASTAITNANLIVGTVTTATSSTVPSGNVISESPAAGTSVAKNTAVNLVVSIGSVVPNVVGMTPAAAAATLQAAGLVVGAQTTVVNPAGQTVATGTVAVSNPVQGTSINVGASVNLVVDSGPAALSTNGILVASGAASSYVTLTTPAALGAWTATSNSPFLHVVAGSGTGTGTASISFTVDAFTGSGVRTGTLTIDGLTFTVTQAGSNYAATGELGTPITGSLNAPDGVATDGFGNVYIADTANNVIKKWSPATQTMSTLISSGLTAPEALVVDGSGNLFIGDSTTLYKWTTLSQTLTTITSAYYDDGVTLDAAGNLFYTGFDGVYKVPAATTSASKVYGIAANSGNPRNVAVDSAGNVYGARSTMSTSYIDVWNAGSGQVTQLLTGSNGIWGVGLDSAANVYYSEVRGSDVKMYNAATQQISTLFVGTTTGTTNRYHGLALDPSANLYVAETDANVIGQYAKAYAPTSGSGEPNAAGTDAMPPVIPATINLTGTFAPTSDQAWLTIGSVANGVVNFAFTANTTGAPRTGHITVLGVPYTVTQGVQPPTITEAFLPSSVAPNTTSALTFRLSNPAANPVSLTSVAFTDTLPAGLVLGTPSGLGNGCGGTATAQAGGTVLALTGVSLAPGASCTLTVNITSATAGSYTNSTGAVTFGGAGTGATASATLTVVVTAQSVFVANLPGSVSSFLDNGTTGGTPGAQSPATAGGGIGAAVDASGFVWSINSNGNGISKFTDAGLFSISYAGGGTAAATAIAIDGQSKVFVTNGNGTVNALTNSGAAVFSTPVAAANAISSPTAISVDAAGSLWIASAGDNSAVEIIGVAAPVVTPTVNTVINANPGTRP